MKTFEIRGKVWRYEGPGGWYFVYVSKDISQRVKDASRIRKKVGFQFVRVRATLGKTSWNTTLFPTKEGPYLIAIKADVRHKEGVDVGDVVRLSWALL